MFFCIKFDIINIPKAGIFYCYGEENNQKIGEKADGGVFITLEEPTKPMKEEAVSAGSYGVRFAPAKFPKIQILTIDELLSNKKPDAPLITVPYYKEAKAAKVESRNNKLEI